MSKSHESKSIEVKDRSHDEVIHVDFEGRHRTDPPQDPEISPSKPNKVTIWKRRALALGAAALLMAGGVKAVTSEPEDIHKLSKDDVQLLRKMPDGQPRIVDGNLYYGQHAEGPGPDKSTLDGVAHQISVKTEDSEYSVPVEVAKEEVQTLETPNDGIPQPNDGSVIQQNEHIVAKIPLDKID